MIIQSTGINAYTTTDQISQPPAEKQPAAPTEQKDTQSNGFITDRTDISARALALSRSVPAAGSNSEQGETKEENTSSPLPQPQNTPTSPPSINIRV